jgi:DNA-binding transcriptional ArsR family regulator
VQGVLEAMADPKSRAILAATSERSRSATELSTQCDIPLSTTYRKVDELTSLGLLVERTRLSRPSSHPDEYRRAVDGLTVSIAPDGVTVHVTSQFGRHDRIVPEED